jgi:hypothetical protein
MSGSPKYKLSELANPRRTPPMGECLSVTLGRRDQIIRDHNLGCTCATQQDAPHMQHAAPPLSDAAVTSSQLEHAVDGRGLASVPQQWQAHRR